MNEIIDWTPPEPRQGMDGTWDKFIGPGATNAEIWLQLVPALLMAALILGLAWLQDIDWTIPQWIVASLLTLDLLGGVLTNATASAKRWYHRPEQGFRQHFGFVVIHLHPFLVGWLFRDGDWAFGVWLYGFLLVASLIILKTPLYLQRPMAMALYVAGLLLGLYLFDPTPGLEWFIPVFYLKLLVSHLLKEAPFASKANISNQKQ